jgi:hypothetical protein
MLDYAYPFFFVAILLAGIAAIHVWLMRDWPRLVAALNGQLPQDVPVSPNAGEIHVWERRQPMLQPAVISICRI